MLDPTLDMLSRFARPGTPLHRIMQRRMLGGGGASAYIQPPGAYGTPSMSAEPPGSHPQRDLSRQRPPQYRYTGVGGVGGGGSNTGVQRGDFQMGGFPAGGSLHLAPGLNLSPGLRFGRAVSTSNGMPLTHPSMPGMIASATRLRGTSRDDAVGIRGPW